MACAVKQYSRLNQLADRGGIVILGGSADLQLPLGELQQAFFLEDRIYNRSLEDLTLAEAPAAFDAWAAPLAPEALLLHLGEADRTLFARDPASFEHAYRSLIAAVRSRLPHCRIALVSLRGPDSDGINRCLKHLSSSEGCVFGDINTRRVWNPKSTRDTADFLYSLGLVRSPGVSRPLEDLTALLYTDLES